MGQVLPVARLRVSVVVSVQILYQYKKNQFRLFFSQPKDFIPQIMDSITYNNMRNKIRDGTFPEFRGSSIKRIFS